MGRVRTNAVKKAARHIIEKYYPRLTTDFHVNKRIAEEVAIIPSKRLRNKIAGYLSHLMRRIEKGPVRGISFKLQVCLFPVASFFLPSLHFVFLFFAPHAFLHETVPITHVFPACLGGGARAQRQLRP